MKITYRALPALALGVAVLLTGCSTGVDGNPVAGVSPTTSAADVPTGDSTSPTSGPTSSGPDLGSIVLPSPPTTAPSTTQQDDGSGRTSEQSGTTTTPAPPTSQPSTSTPPPVTTTVGSSSTPQTTTASGSTTDPFAGATTVDPAKFPGTVTPVGFSTPSGNISCGFQPTKTPSVVCQIDRHTYPNPPPDCHGAGAPGGAVTLSVGGPAEFMCAGDLESGGPTLAYGSMISVSGLQCVSRETGVTCRDTSTGNRFRLASASYELVNGGKTTAATAAASGSALSRFTGTWSAHGAQLIFSAPGKGKAVYRTYTWCSDSPKPCDDLKGNEIVAGGTFTITLTSASTDGMSATGTITASNDPSYAVGTPVTATISGYNLTIGIHSSAFGPFCAPNTPSDKWNCGA